MNTPSRQFSAKLLPLALASLGCSLWLQAAPGDLDLTFAPQMEPWDYPNVTFGNNEIYLYSSTNIVRLRADGQIDPEWQLAPPVTGSHVYRFGALPGGGWYLSTLSESYVVNSDHRYVKLTTSLPFVTKLFPQDNGGLVFTGPGLGRFTPAASTDVAYRERAVLKTASFRAADGTWAAVGSLRVSAALDTKDRLIVAGNFIRAGVQERITLARLLPDGTVDPDWNPGAQLNLTVDTEGFLSSSPFSVTASPDDSVLVEFGFGTPEPVGEKPRYLVWIDAKGAIRGRSVSIGGFTGPLAPIIQPDGKIIVPAIIQWDGTERSGVRLEHDGSLDPTWKLSIEDAGPNLPSAISSMAFDHSGRLLLAGLFRKVNGIPRPGVARVFAYDLPVTSPQADISVAQAHVTTNETLRLTAHVGGWPSPALQWFRNGEPIVGATNRGLEFPIRDLNSGGSFNLSVSNEIGIKLLDFPEVAVTERSPAPGQTTIMRRADPSWGKIHQLLVQPDGRILLCFSGYWLSPEDVPMLVRLTPEGTVDPSFGQGGIVKGNGHLESMRLLPDGGILVAGLMSRFGGANVSGVAELDADGKVRSLSFPELSDHYATAALKLTDGRYVIAGSFTNIAGVDVFRLARLTADLQVDASFKPQFEYWQMISDLAQDAEGRLLVAGGGINAPSGEALNNPAPVGVRRLLGNGAVDPEFAVNPKVATQLFIEPGGTILAGMPARRLNNRGEVVTEFGGQSQSQVSPKGVFQTDHRMVRSPEGGILFGSDEFPLRIDFRRWEYNGDRNYSFAPVFPTNTLDFEMEAGALLPDGSTLVAAVVFTQGTGGERYLLRVLPDFDLRFSQTQKTEAGIKASILTQPGFHYTVRQRPNLSGPAGAVVAELEGDGYRQDVVIPDSSTTGFLEYVRQ